MIRPLIQRSDDSLQRRLTLLFAIISAVSRLAVAQPCNLPFMSVHDPQPLNSTAANDGSVEDREVQVVSDGHGMLLAVWSAVGAFGNDADILYARSFDQGMHWTDVLPLNSNASTD